MSEPVLGQVVHSRTLLISAAWPAASDNAPQSSSSLSGTIPNVLMIFASLNCPTSGSPVRLNAMAPTLGGVRTALQPVDVRLRSSDTHAPRLAPLLPLFPRTAVPRSRSLALFPPDLGQVVERQPTAHEPRGDQRFVPLDFLKQEAVGDHEAADGVAQVAVASFNCHVHSAFQIVDVALWLRPAHHLSFRISSAG